MSTEYTDSAYSQATESTNDTADDTQTASEETPASTTEEGQSVENKETEEQKEGEETQETEDGEKKQEEEPKPEPEPEPEPDPLEGIRYEDDPDQPLNAYGDKYYWEARYIMDPECFEWYQDPENLKPILNELVDKEGRVLIVGNGTSKLPAVVTENGCESCEVIDFAQSAVKRMRKQNKEIENIKCKVMDVTDMQYGEGEFQAVIDKACLDTVLYQGDSQVNQMMAEVSRVLKKRGVFICLSCHPPEEMKPYIDNPAELLLEVEKVEELPKPLPSNMPHYCYIVRKVGKLMT